MAEGSEQGTGGSSPFDAMLEAMRAYRPLPKGGPEALELISLRRDLAKGEFFLRSGEVPRLVGFLASGWLRHFHVGSEGREYMRYFCSGGNFVTSQTALLEGRPSEYSIQAVEDSRLVVIDYRDWLSLSEKDSAWVFIHKAVLDAALATAERRERSLVLDDAAERYRRFLAEYPGAELHLRQYDIASYLGISPVTLSRLRGRRERN
jgi:CRP-like cAMP-binding protein